MHDPPVAKSSTSSKRNAVRDCNAFLEGPRLFPAQLPHQTVDRVGGLPEVLRRLGVHCILQLLPHELVVLLYHAVHLCVCLSPRQPVILGILLRWGPLVELSSSFGESRVVPAVREEPRHAVAADKIPHGMATRGEAQLESLERAAVVLVVLPPKLAPRVRVPVWRLRDV